MTKYIIFIPLFFLGGCDQSNQSSFNKFITILPELKLPLNLRCGFNGPYFNEDSVDSKILEPFIYVGRHVAGKFKSTKKVIPILFFNVL